MHKTNEEVLKEDEVKRSRMERISWTEHKTNEEVLKEVEKRCLMDIIRTRQKNWIGHIIKLHRNKTSKCY